MVKTQDTKLMRVCAEQAIKSDTFEAYADLVKGIGQSAKSIVTTCLLAIQLYRDATNFFATLTQDSRALPPNKAVAAVQARMDE